MVVGDDSDRAMAVCGAAAAERRSSAADCRRLFIDIILQLLCSRRVQHNGVAVAGLLVSCLLLAVAANFDKS